VTGLSSYWVVPGTRLRTPSSFTTRQHPLVPQRNVQKTREIKDTTTTGKR